eukprot:gene26192-31629_t
MGAAGSVLNDEPPANRTNNSTGVKPKTTTDDGPKFTVSLGHWPESTRVFPSSFTLRISAESLDFVELNTTTVIVQFPFQNILCWGSSPQNFQFKVFDSPSSTPSSSSKNGGVLITLKTPQGKSIEAALMSTVQKLMADMNAQAISASEFSVLLTNILTPEGKLKENWLEVIDQFTMGDRRFLAKQGMELMFRVSPHAPFEKLDLACLIYERMLNKNAIQLLINTLEDPVERENLTMRIQAISAGAQKKASLVAAKQKGEGSGTESSSLCSPVSQAEELI